jgi:uncharacterized protein (TIGR02646 family)
MISVRRSLTPKELTEPALEVAQERDAVVKFYEDEKNLNAEYSYKIYSRPYVKEIIERLFHGKCAYCESKYEATQPMDVEHYRPKGAILVNGKKKKPGYYWLASDWDNLLPSCIDCNRDRKQTMPDGKVITQGKKNQFPVADESQRAKKPGQETGEIPLLLHPCFDTPEEHLTFTVDGLVQPAEDQNNLLSPKGASSIIVCALLRRGLVKERREHAKKIRAQMKRVERARENMKKYPEDLNFEKDMKQELKDLKAYMKPEQRYSGMAKQLITEFLRSL